MICCMALASPLQGTLPLVQGCEGFAVRAREVNNGPNLRVRAPLVVRATTSSSSSSSSSSSEEQQPTGHSEPPRLENFSQSRLSRSMRERTLLQKAESALFEKCMALEGEEAYQCWEALFEYEHLKEEYETECDLALRENKAEACRPLERFENMVRQSGGANSLIDNVRMRAKVAKKKAEIEKEKLEDHAHYHEERTPEQILAEQHERYPDGGIPMTLDEIDHENDGLMPDSKYTRFLRRAGKTPAWFTHPPEHETD